MDYNLFRVGNMVLYSKNTPYLKHRATITEINQDGTMMLSYKRYPNDEVQTAKAELYEISAIPVNIHILHGLGFVLNEKTKVISRNGVNIINTVYLKPLKDDLGNTIPLYDFKGFRLVVKTISAKRDEEEVMANTVDVNAFHALQNYYSINYKEEITL